MAEPKPRVIKSGSTLRPYDKLSGIQLEEHESGQVFQLAPLKGRKHNRNSLYWVGLQNAVDATDNWLNRNQLHRELKLNTGYTTTLRFGSVDWVVDDSTAFDKMTEPEFDRYFNKARDWFIMKYGFDAWEV